MQVANLWSCISDESIDDILMNTSSNDFFFFPRRLLHHIRVIEELRLEKTFKIIKSNHHRMLTSPPLNHVS